MSADDCSAEQKSHLMAEDLSQLYTSKLTLHSTHFSAITSYNHDISLIPMIDVCTTMIVVGNKLTSRRKVKRKVIASHQQRSLRRQHHIGKFRSEGRKLHRVGVNFHRHVLGFTDYSNFVAHENASDDEVIVGTCDDILSTLLMEVAHHDTIYRV